MSAWYSGMVSYHSLVGRWVEQAICWLYQDYDYIRAGAVTTGNFYLKDFHISEGNGVDCVF